MKIVSTTGYWTKSVVNVNYVKAMIPRRQLVNIYLHCIILFLFLSWRLEQNEKSTIVRFLALVTTMVTMVDHGNDRSNHRSNHRGNNHSNHLGYYDRYYNVNA